MPGHFAERHNLIIILALGESVIALGAGATVELDATVAFVGALGIGLAAALWWIYFDIVAIVTARRLELAAPGRERNRLARDSYSYLHFPMAAGIVLSALAFEEAVPHGGRTVRGRCRPWRCSAARRSTCSPTSPSVCATPAPSTSSGWCLAIVLVALVPLAVSIDAVWALAIVNVLLWAMITFETLWVYGDTRFRLRHDLDAEIPSRGHHGAT